MNVERRRRVEKAIVRRAVLDLLKAGYTLNVDNGGDGFELPAPSGKAKVVLAEMFATDEERLFAFRDGRPVGWLWCVYGNSGYDCIADHTANLADVLRGAGELAERYEATAW
jgi:hypothetical protein